MAARRHFLWRFALALASTPAAAASIATVDDLPERAQVIDIRAETDCVAATLPGARCLPAAWLFAAEGGPIEVGALRWLLGTLGLTGAETVAIWPADAPEAAATAAFLHLAGQREVVLFAGPAVPDGRGETRSFSREAVFTAPMRRGALEAASTQPQASLATRLAAFARGETETVAFGPAD